MPKPLNVNWDLAKGLYLQGINMAEVSRRTGISYDALRAKASRCGWRETVTALSQDVTVQANKSLAEQGKAWKERIGKLVNRQLNAVEAKDATKLKLSELETLARITDATDRTARRTFGMDSETHTVTLQIQSELSASTQHQLPVSSDQVIDVETESSPKPRP